MNNPEISLCMSIYNQENIIEKVLSGLYNNISENVKEFILLFDGCTDKTEAIVRNLIAYKKLQPKIFYSDDIHEVRANNLCFKQCQCEYILTVQDDIQVLEKDFDKRMIKPFNVVCNLLGVTGRDAVETGIMNNDLYFYNTIGTDATPKTPRNIFGIRQIINRGPILLNHEKLRSLNYLDEDFAPVNQDDTDLFLRGIKKGYLCGAYTIDYISDVHWGSTRRIGKSSSTWERFAPIHRKMIIERHFDLITGPKYPVDIIIE